MRRVMLALCLSVLAASCSKKELSRVAGQNGTSTLNDTTSAISLLSTSYGTEKLQKADVYLPAHRNGSTRTIVMVHGGGWTSGDKSDLTGYVTELQKRLPGYAIVNMNYRLITIDSTYFPMQENDMILAMQYLKSNAAAYHVSSDVVLLGLSAGAQLALLQGYKHNDVIHTLGVISFFGPTDLSDLFVHYSDTSISWVLQKILGGVLQEDPQVFRDASPINYVNAASPPTLLLHGDADPLVPVSQAYKLLRKLDSVGVRNQLIVYPGQGHGWSGPDLTDSFNKVQAFITSL